MDPVKNMLASWRKERAVLETIKMGDVVALCEAREAAVRQLIAEITEMKVPYAYAEPLTGWRLGSLKNSLENIGTRGDPAFRFGDLPFKHGYASPGKLVMALGALDRLLRE